MSDRDTIDETTPVPSGDTGRVRRVLTESAEDLRAEFIERRLGELEAWRREAEPWRLRLTGLDERNGRLGRIDHAIALERDERLAGDVAVRVAVKEAVAEVRADVGDAAECKRVRAAAAVVNGTSRWGRRLIAGTVALVLGGGGYAVWRAHDESVAGAARLDQRLHQHETDIDRLYGFCRAPRPDPARTP